MTFHPTLDAAARAAASLPDPVLFPVVLGLSILASAALATLAVRTLFR